MASNGRGSGRILDLVMAANILSGKGVLVGDVFGVTTQAGANGDTIPCLTEGLFVLPKLGTDDMTQGLKLYWDNTNKRLTLSSASGANKAVGHVHVAAGTSATEVEAWIHPT